MAKQAWNDMCTEVNRCALTGSAAFFAGIEDAGVVINGPMWCYTYALRYLEKHAKNQLTHRFYCAQPDHQAVIYGTQDCLQQILTVIKSDWKIGALLLQNSCAISLIGDDIAGIAKEMALPFPVIALDSGGLIGRFQEGYRLAAKAYFREILLPERVLRPRTVNLLGCTIGYYNAPNDLRELKRILHLAGYEVLSCPGAGSSIEEISKMTQAELNIVVHEELGLELAKMLEEKYGMAYVSMLPPYGIEGTLEWLALIAEKIGREEENWQRVKREAAACQVQIEREILEMERFWEQLWLPATMISGPTSIALAIAKALRREWLDTGSLTVFLHEGELPAIIPVEIDHILLDQEMGEKMLGQTLDGLSGGLLLGSSNDKMLLYKRGIKDFVYQNIALPVYDEVIFTEQPFMGFQGATYLMQQIYNQYYREQVRQIDFVKNC